jgi:hypothetical protein
MRIEFKFGEILPAKDPLARWIVKLAMIHNDLVFANNNLLKAKDGTVDWFYWYRYALAHYHEAMNLLAEEKDAAEVATFVAGMSAEARKLYDDALAIHKEVEAAASRVRNEATFHYPGEQARNALDKALRDLAGDKGIIDSGESNKVKDVRFSFADEVAGKLFYRAMGNGDTELARITERYAVGEKSLMQFINHAMDEFFVRLVQK